MKIAYFEKKTTREYFVLIDGHGFKIRAKRVKGTSKDNQGQTCCTCQGRTVKLNNDQESIEIIPALLKKSEGYNYARIRAEDLPAELTPISWHELPLLVKQQILQIEEDAEIGIYDRNRPFALFIG